jgi:hypothetical protein
LLLEHLVASGQVESFHFDQGPCEPFLVARRQDRTRRIRQLILSQYICYRYQCGKRSRDSTAKTVAAVVPTNESNESRVPIMSKFIAESPRVVRRSTRSRLTPQANGQVASKISNNGYTFLLAIVASIGILLLRLQGCFSTVWLWTEFLICISIAISARAHFSIHRESTLIANNRSGILCAIGSILIGAPWGISLIQRQFLDGFGEATELIWLAMLQNAALWQAAVATTSKQEWTSLLLSSFLMLFGVSASDRSGMIWIVVLFGLLASWSLMVRYWQSIERGFVAVESVPLVRMRIILVAILCTVTTSIGAVAMLNKSSITLLDGFMPTSGGKKDADPSARNGVGDGDMLVAAQDEAYTFGPVDSDLFLDSQVPSMYDLASDMYGEPKSRPTKFMRAIALSSDTKETTEEGSESKKKGREFSAIREPVDRSNPIKPKGSDSRAILYLIGETPQHLRLESYDSFDGTEWTHSENLKSPPQRALPRLRTLSNKPWMELEQINASIVHPVRERLTIKLINIQSPRILSPSLLTDVHIDRIDQPDFFGWTPDGQPMMPNCDSIPQLTVVHQIYQIPQLHCLRDASDPLSAIVASSQPNDWLAPYLTVPGNRQSLRSEAERLMQPHLNKSPKRVTDWGRIEALVTALRQDFEVDLSYLPPDSCDDVVQHMIETRRGPDYLVATTASVLIRSLDTPARLVTGFYASPSRFDIRSGQTEVLREDLHTWVEVYVHGAWLPIEPCSQFAKPREFRSWRQFAIQGWWLLCDTAVRNPVSIATTVFFLATAVYVRRRIVDAACSSVFLSTHFLSIRSRVRWSLVLLRWRMWVWGVQCPRRATVRQWLESQLVCDPRLKPSERQLFVDAVQRLAYAPTISTAEWLNANATPLGSISWAITQRGLLDLFRSKSTGHQWSDSQSQSRKK